MFDATVQEKMKKEMWPWPCLLNFGRGWQRLAGKQKGKSRGDCLHIFKRSTDMGVRRILRRELFLYTLDLEFKRARRSAYSFCVLRLRLSKGPGKENGKELQECYKSLANWVSGELREIDTLGFMADDELAVLLPYTDLAGSVRVRSRLGRRLKYFDFQTDGYEVMIDEINFPKNGRATENPVLQFIATKNAMVV